MSFKTLSIAVSAIALMTAASASFSSAYAQGKIIGVSWSNFQEERWKTDEAAIKAVIAANGDTYISADAQSSPAKQLTDIDSLITKKANALIILAMDTKAIIPAFKKAADEGIPVVAYDRLVEVPSAFYISFDNFAVGQMQAAAVYKAAPKGNYVFIKGASTDPNADILFAGQMSILKDAIAKGDVKNVGEEYTPEWLPSKAQTNMEQILSKNNNKVTAVVAANDGTAGGVVAALTAQGLAGTVPVSGQDGDKAALNRVALGTQTVSVWKDARELGKQAATIATQMAGGTKLADLKGTSMFDGGPTKVKMVSLLLKPVAITKDNLDVVINAGWISKDVVCQGVKPGTVAACK